MDQRRPRGDIHTGDSGGVREPDAVLLPVRSSTSGNGDRSRELSRLDVAAHAKINLYLKILRKRPDGFHDIETAVQTVSLHDTLSLELRREGICLEVDDKTVPPGPENLAWRAAAVLQAPGSAPRGVHIRIRKAIPAGAGLGGGSSDAAAALLGLRRLWGLDLPDRELEILAASIGSDVPFFLHGGTALLRGTGTLLKPLPDLDGYEVLIVFPGVPLSTRKVYAGTSESLTSALKISSMAGFEHTLKGDLAKEVETWVRAGNDLEPYARSLCPPIGEIKDGLETAGAGAAAMTGSGSAVFGVFRNPDAIERAVAFARKRGFAAVRCVPLGREEYQRRVAFQ